MKDEDTHRNDWPLGRIIEAIKSQDGEVRKAHVELLKEQKKEDVLASHKGVGSAGTCSI